MGSFPEKPEFPFPLPSYEDWLTAARQELDGANPMEKLVARNGELEIFPFYTATHSPSNINSLLQVSLQPFHGARSWANTPKIPVTDEQLANDLAMKYLSSGAEGLVFECSSKNINPAILLDRISLPDCMISFLIHNEPEDWLEEFRQYAEANFDTHTIKGCLFWSTPNKNRGSIIRAFSDWTQFCSLGILVNTQENASDEIAQCLVDAVTLVEELQHEGMTAPALLDQISFSVNVGTDFFLEIAKLKSLRLLWHQVKGAYNSSSERPLHIHVQSAAWIKNEFQPHGNMIKATATAMAAIAGGCDSLTIEPEDYTNETMSRISRNVSSILREEAHFSKVADPTAGSYYLEAITHQLAEKAWNKFQRAVQ